MRAVAVIFNAYVTKKIGTEAVGLFTLVMSVYTLAVTLATSSINLAAVRLVSEKNALCEKHGICGRERDRELRRVMSGCIKYSLFFGIFASLLLFSLSDVIGIRILKDERTVISLKVLSAALPAISLSSALAGYFTGLRKVYKNAVISLLEQFVKITITSLALMIIAPRGVKYACLAVVGGSAVAEGASLISSVILYLFDKSKKTGKCKETLPVCRSALRDAAGIAFPVAVGSYLRQGLICAEHIAIPAGLRKFGKSSAEALSGYGVLHGMAFPLILFPSSVIGAFSALLIPELSESSAVGKKREITAVSEKTMRLSLIFSIGVAGIFLAFGECLGEFIYSSTEVGRYIRMIAPLVPIMYLDTAVDAVLKGIGEQVYCMKVNILDAFLSLVLVLVLVPIMGVFGYIVCIYITEIVNDTLSIIRMISRTHIRLSPMLVIKPFLLILISCGAVSFFCSRLIITSAVVKVSLSAVVYAVLTLCTRCRIRILRRATEG